MSKNIVVHQKCPTRTELHKKFEIQNASTVIAINITILHITGGIFIFVMYYLKIGVFEKHKVQL